MLGAVRVRVSHRISVFGESDVTCGHTDTVAFLVIREHIVEASTTRTADQQLSLVRGKVGEIVLTELPRHPPLEQTVAGDRKNLRFLTHHAR